MQAIAKLGKSVGISGVMITNGFIEADPMNKLLDVLSAVKVDFKAYNDDFYKRICHGRLKPVLETMKRVRERGTWLEMVHLTLPTLNDNSDQIKALCNWVLKNLGPDVPLHFTRFHPIYKLKNLPATPPSTLERAWVIAKKEGIHYPYVGNLSGHDGENTHCHECGKLLIKRIGYSVVENHIHNGKCSACGATIPGVWDMG
jgi:pyruvate formate lyase activating enzyme